MAQKILGDFQFVFPNSWKTCYFEAQTVRTGVVIKANSNGVVVVTFRNTYTFLPMVVPVVYTEGNTWSYYTSMISNMKKTGCNINIHNLESKDITVSVGYIIMG